MKTSLLAITTLFAAATLAQAGCSDDAKTPDNSSGGPSGSSGGPSGPEGAAPPQPSTPEASVFALSSVLFGPEGNTTYVSLLNNLEPQTLDYTKAIELSSWADMWVHEGEVFVSDGESPTITKYTLADNGTLVKGTTISFAGKGVTDAAFWANTFVASDKAYMLNGVSEYVVWNPKTMEITGSIALPALEPRDGFGIRNGTTDRSNVIRDGKLYQPFYWSDDDYVRFAPDSKVAVIDIATNTLVETIDVPCAGIDIGTKDANGDLYFSTWTSGVVQPLMKETPSNCVGKIAAGANTATAAFKFADVAGGREGAAVRYDGVGQILFPVFHNERTTYADASELLEQLGKPNWHLWSYDRAANTATELTSVDWNSGAVYVLPVGGKTHLLIPDADYATTKVIRLDGATATPLIETRGWAIRLFQIR